MTITHQHQSLNGYSYANSTPVTSSDPTGLMDPGGTVCGIARKCVSGPEWNEGVPEGGVSESSSDTSGTATSPGDWENEGSNNADLNGDGFINVYPGVQISAKWKPQMSANFIQVFYDRLDECYTGLTCYADGAEANAYPIAVNAHLACAEVGCPDRKKMFSQVITTGLHEVFANGPNAGKLSPRPKTIGGGCGQCFLAGTDVLMSDGKTEDIDDVEVGDYEKATDPKTGETGPRKVTRLIVTEDDKHFNTLSIATDDGIEELTATYEHPFWSPSESRWIEASELVPGMTLLTDDGTTVIVTGNRSFTRHAHTYNLTVDDLHTYYVLAGDTPVLVHNSSCLTTAGNSFPGVAHTLDEHVGISDAKAISLAASKPGGKNSVFIDRQTAQQVADYSIAFNQTRINKWLRGSQHQLTFSGRFGANNSLGTTFYADGSRAVTGNGYFIQLTRTKGHPGVFYISTLYPK